MKKTISIIVAMTPSGVIGYKGDLPWNIPSDLKRFRELTVGNTVIMGRKTFESIYTKIGHPLRKRLNIVLSRDEDYGIEDDDCLVASSIDGAITMASENGNGDEIFIAGGSDIYELTLERITKMYITYVDTDCPGDSFFPKFNAHDWETESCKNWSKKKGDDFRSRDVVYKKKSTNYVNLAHARTVGQVKVMRKIEEDGVCPFCYEHILKYHTGEILKESKWWTVIENFAPYDGVKVQLVIIYKHHVEMFSEIKPAAGSELPEIIRWAEKKYGIDGGAFFCRFGNTELTGSSVNHLHIQLIVGNSNRNKNRSTPLLVKLGYYMKK